MNDELNAGAVDRTKTAKSSPATMQGRAGSALHRLEVQRFERLLQEDPAYAYRRCGLALLYSLPGRRLVEELKKFGWKARDAQDLFNCGALHSEAGDHKGALKYYEKAVEIDPRHWSAHYNLALTYEQLEDARKARAAMQKCVKILEEKPELYSWEKEDLETARKFLEGQ